MASTKTPNAGIVNTKRATPANKGTTAKANASASTTANKKPMAKSAAAPVKKTARGR